MAKNETKIKFSAEVSEFNDGINKAAAKIQELSSELKLNAAKAENAEDSTELLESRLKLLEAQYEATKDKSENLNSKLQKAKEIYGENSSEVSKLKLALNNSEVASEKIKSSISKLSAELNSNTSDAKQLDSAMDGLADGFDKASNAAKDTDGYTMSKDVLSDLATNGIMSVVGGFKDMVGSIFSLAEETKEFRGQMAKLDSVFTTNGYSLDQAQSVYKDFYGILGDETAATTTASNLSNLKLKQEDLSKLTNSMIGIWSAYGDSIPLDGLAESINETSKVGAVTGGLADALNWAGISEDSFNETLQRCNGEHERQQRIIEILGSKYDGLAATYSENNKSVIDSNKANADYQQTMSNMGSAIEPVTTGITNLKTQALEKLIPVVTGTINVVKDIVKYFKEHENAAMALKAVLIVLGVIFLGLAVQMGIVGIITAVSAAIGFLGGAIAFATSPITLIIIAVLALVAGFMYLWDNCEGFRNFWTGLWEGIKNVFTTVWTAISSFFSGVWTGLTEGVAGAWEGIKALVGSWIGFFADVWNGIKSVFSTVGNFFGDIFSTAWAKVKGVFTAGGEIFSGITESISSVFKTVVNGLITGINFVVALPFKAINKVLKKVRDTEVLGYTPFDFINLINVPQIPMFAKGGIVNGATLNIAGEAGPEAITPIDKLQTYIFSSVTSALQSLSMANVIKAIENLSNRAIELNINGQRFAEATASDSDRVNGDRISLTERGVAY